MGGTSAEFWGIALFRIGTIFLAVFSSVALLVAVRRRVPLQVLREQHDVAGVSFAVIGGFYGVLLAFVLVASWERFERARADTEAEANAAGDLFRQASALPQPVRDKLRGEVIDYIRSVIDDEWPAMQRGEFSPRTQELGLRVWSTIVAIQTETPKQVALFQVMLQKLDEFGEQRRYRRLYMMTSLPPVIWYFLISFGIVTVSFTYFFGMPRLLPQAIITVVLATTIVCTLFIIYEMQTPFSGMVVVPDRDYRVILPLLEQGATP